VTLLDLAKQEELAAAAAMTTTAVGAVPTSSSDME
jgi:hypothetical protein